MFYRVHFLHFDLNHTLQPVVPQPSSRRRGAHTRKGSAEAIAIRRAVRGSATNPDRFGDVDSADLPPHLDDRKQFIFYSDDGGYRATDEQNNSMDSIYYFGIIDICTRYTIVKKLEHIWKGLSADSVCFFLFHCAELLV
jgi:Phosphatidylinositol-4-phosphate 5-Kinase